MSRHHDVISLLADGVQHLRCITTTRVLWCCHVHAGWHVCVGMQCLCVDTVWLVSVNTYLCRPTTRPMGLWMVLVYRGSVLAILV